MALQTQGFHVSALPIAPTVPAGLGEFDASRARRQAAEQIELYKRLANLTAEQRATQAALALKAKQDISGIRAVDPLVDAKVADAGATVAEADTRVKSAGIKSRILSKGEEPMVRGGVGALQETEASINDKQDAREDLLTLRARGQYEAPSIQARIEEASKLADHDAEAADLEKIQAGSPWLSLPEHKVLADTLKTATANARARAMQQQKDAAAVSRTSAVRPPTGLTATIQLLLNEGYTIDDPVIQKLLLKQSAETAADPTADRTQRATTAAGLQGLRNTGAETVQGLRNTGAAEVQGLRNTGAAEVQGLRNEGAERVQGLRNEGHAAEHEREVSNYMRYTQLAADEPDPDKKEMWEEYARNSKARADVLTKPKTGAATQANVVAERAARHTLVAHEDSTKRLNDAIDKAFSQVGITSAGPAAHLKWVGGIPPTNLAASLKSIVANVGFDMLTQMRAQSKSGGALGSVSDEEGRKLDAVLGSLEQTQGPSQLKENLIRVKDAIQLAQKRMQEAYAIDFPQGASGAGPTAAPTTPPQFETGKVYTDAQGNKATYLGNGQWQEVR